MANIAKKSPHKQRRSQNPVGFSEGLSFVSHLTAGLTIKKRQNAEGQAFILEKYERKTTKKSNPKGRAKGKIIQNNLTKRGRKTIRVVSDCYGLLVQDKDFRDRNDLQGYYDGSSCRFITLTFRNIIPSDMDAKRLLDSFFKRLTRLFGRSVHYLWVAERQKRGAIHFHILTPENISKQLSKGTESSAELRMIENTWINRAWNETVKNWCVRNGKISKIEGQKWTQEYDLSENYYRSKIRFQVGLRTTEPPKPKKSKYLLLPNLVHVFKAGNYMAKYMSKEGQNIIGGMYGASHKSRQFLTEKIICQKSFGYVMEANQVIEYMMKRAEQEKKYIGTWTLEHNAAKGIWCDDVYLLLQWYYEYMETLKTKKKQPLKVAVY